MNLKTTLSLTVIATLIILSAGCIDNTTETEYVEFTDTDGDGITDPYLRGSATPGESYNVPGVIYNIIPGDDEVVDWGDEDDELIELIEPEPETKPEVKKTTPETNLLGDPMDEGGFFAKPSDKTLSQSAGGVIRGGLVEAGKLAVIGTGGGLDFLSSIVGVDLGLEKNAREGVKDWFEPTGKKSSGFGGEWEENTSFVNPSNDVPAGPPTPDMEQTVESTLESDPIVTTGATSGIELTIPDVPTIETLVCDIVENVDSRASSTAWIACDRGFFIESNYDYDAGVAILSTKQSYYYIAQTWVTIGGTRFIIDPQTNFYWNETDHETEFGESYKIEFVPVKKGTELVKSCTDYWAIF